MKPSAQIDRAGHYVSDPQETRISEIATILDKHAEQLAALTRGEGMSGDKIRQVCHDLSENIVAFCGLSARRRTDDPQGVTPDHFRHCLWMLEQIPEFLAQGRREKAMRWIGYVQGFGTAAKVWTVLELEQINAPDGAVIERNRL